MKTDLFFGFMTNIKTQTIEKKLASGRINLRATGNYEHGYCTV